MKLTSKGQVTIPRELRERFGLHARAEVVFEPAAGGVLIKPAPAGRVERLRSALRRVRGRAETGRTTAQILRATRGEG